MDKSETPSARPVEIKDAPPQRIIAEPESADLTKNTSQN